jgi:hypothetical protein
MGFLDWIKGGSAKVATDLVVGTAEGINDIVDRWVQNPEEKAEMLREIREFELTQKEMALDADRAIFEDRISARRMAGTHGKLQTAFALTFLAGFLALLVADLAFIGWLIVQWQTDGASIPEWLQILVPNTLTGVIAYMVSMLKEVVGFLFGGSAGGDESAARLAESLRESGTTRPPE